MTNTGTKLDEAKYFLTRMKEEVANREPFKYNLSAFLSASRSVTFVMQTEFHDMPGFLGWYDEKQSQMSEDSLMRFMKEKRNIALKQETIDPRGHIDVTVKSNITITEHVVAVLTHKNGTVERIEHKQPPPPPPSTSETEVKYRWFFEDISDKDIITLSQEYVDKLESLVSECKSKFISEQRN